VDDIDGVNDTWEPCEKGEKEVEPESCVATGPHDHGDGRKEDGQDVETDIAGHCDCMCGWVRQRKV